METEQQLIAKQGNQQKHISTANILFHASMACMGSFIFGYSLGELNMAQPKLNLVYDVIRNDPKNEDIYVGILNSAVPLGAGIGCIIAGILLNKMGRRQIFLLCDLVGIISSLIFMIDSYYVAVFSRFLLGFIVGINSTVVPLYLREISPIVLSGPVGVLNQGNCNLGILAGYIFGLGFPIDATALASQSGFYWRLVLAFPVVTCSLRMITFMLIFKHDTAPYYLQNKRYEEARQVIEKNYLPEYQDEIYNQLKIEGEQKAKKVDTWALVFSKNNSSRLLLGSMVSFFQQFSGINAIVFYSANIFKDTTGDQQVANIMTVISGIVLMIFSFGSSIFTVRFGRKSILLAGQIALICFLIPTGVVSYITRNDNENISTLDTVLIIGFIFCYEIAFSLTSGPLAWVYNADILNSEKSLGFATSINWACAFTIGLIFPSLQKSLGIWNMFYIFAGFCLAGFIYFLIFVKETKGLSQKQIVAIFVSEKESFSGNSSDEEIIKKDSIVY